MYSQSVIQSNIERIERRMRAQQERDGKPLGTPLFRLVRFPADVIAEMTEQIGGLIDKQTGRYSRDLTPIEQRFIDNEMMMCQLDFRYWVENRANIQLASQSDRPAGWEDADEDDESGSGSRIGKFILNGMQIQLLKKLGKLEDLSYEALARGAPVNGVLLILHKARQLGASTFWQALIAHRVNFYSHINALVASIDDKATQALFRRFERIYDGQPIWMQSKVKRRTRDQGIEFERDSVVELQSGKQDKDLGKGETWHAVHVTEAAVFERPEDHFDDGLFSAIPTSLYTLYGMEGTSKGKRGWWFDFVTAVMSGTAEGGAGRFSHYFAPFYLIDMADSSRGQRSKYRMEAPVDWTPSLATQQMMKRVEQTSHLFCDVPRLVLHRDVAFWYESTRNYFHKRGKLNIFLQNFPVDPYESFQHSAAGAFTSETIERLDNNCALYEPQPYELIEEAELRSRSDVNAVMVASNELDRPTHHLPGGYHLVPVPLIDLESDRDPRGVIWIFEQPFDLHFYALGADPAGGIPGWRRAFRLQDDIRTDNGAIEIFRRGKPARPCEECSGRGWKPTTSKGVLVECQACDGRGKLDGRAIQCAEFAAPIDAEEFALYIWALGRLYHGNSEFDECVAVVENNNTGILTIRKLQNTFAYTNLWQSTSMGSEVTPRYTNSIGFYSGPTTVPILHARSRSIVARRDVDVRSANLVREYSDAIVKITGTGSDAESKSIVVRERFVVPPGGGRHDDRMIASFLCFLVLFDWNESGDITGDAADVTPKQTVPELAGRDATAAEQRQRWNDVAAQYIDDDFQLGGHYADCAIDCRADHGADEGDVFGFGEDEDFDSDHDEFGGLDSDYEYDPNY